MATTPKKLLSCGCIIRTNKVLKTNCPSCRTQVGIMAILRGADNTPDAEARIAEIAKVRARNKRLRQARNLKVKRELAEENDLLRAAQRSIDERHGR